MQLKAPISIHERVAIPPMMAAIASIGISGNIVFGV
jgi:hypothetical protein